MKALPQFHTQFMGRPYLQEQVICTPWLLWIPIPNEEEFRLLLEMNSKQSETDGAYVVTVFMMMKNQHILWTGAGS